MGTYNFRHTGTFTTGFLSAGRCSGVTRRDGRVASFSGLGTVDRTVVGCQNTAVLRPSPEPLKTFVESTPMDRVRWTCPKCQSAYSVPSTEGLTLCPKCAPVDCFNSPSEDVKIQEKILLPRRSAISKNFDIKVPFGLFLASIVTVALLSFVVGTLFSPIGVKLAAVNPLAKDPDKVKVNIWLKENLDDSGFEEVKWYPAVEFEFFWKGKIIEREEQLAQIKKNGPKKVKGFDPAETLERDNNSKEDYIREISRHEKEIAAMKTQPPLRVCMMRFRTKNKSGANEIHRRMWDVSDAVASIKSIEWEQLYMQSFIERSK